MAGTCGEKDRGRCSDGKRHDTNTGVELISYGKYMEDTGTQREEYKTKECGE